jgi:hypothetical protein
MGLFPISQQAADDNDLRRVIGGMVGYLQGLMEKGLAIAIGKGSIDIFFLLMQEGYKGFQVARYLVDGSFPCMCIGGSRFFWPAVICACDIAFICLIFFFLRQKGYQLIKNYTRACGKSWGLA